MGFQLLNIYMTLNDFERP